MTAACFSFDCVFDADGTSICTTVPKYSTTTVPPTTHNYTETTTIPTSQSSPDIVSSISSSPAKHLTSSSSPTHKVFTSPVPTTQTTTIPTSQSSPGIVSPSSSSPAKYMTSSSSPAHKVFTSPVPTIHTKLPTTSHTPSYKPSSSSLEPFTNSTTLPTNIHSMTPSGPTRLAGSYTVIVPSTVGVLVSVTVLILAVLLYRRYRKRNISLLCRVEETHLLSEDEERHFADTHNRPSYHTQGLFTYADELEESIPRLYMDPSFVDIEEEIDTEKLVLSVRHSDDSDLEQEPAVDTDDVIFDRSTDCRNRDGR